VGAAYQRAMNLIFHDLLGVILEVCIDDLVVKSASFDRHLAGLRVVFERMRQCHLKMNPLKCAFGVIAGHFLGFIVPEKGIEIDPKRIESIRKIKEPTCKQDVQKLLGKLNYLRWNLAGKIDSLLPLNCLKHESEFVWGVEHSRAVKKIKESLVSPPVLQAPQAGMDFKLYIAAQEKVIGAVLTQVDGGTEFAVAYLS
jgi:hypothetical protein